MNEMDRTRADVVEPDGRWRVVAAVAGVAIVCLVAGVLGTSLWNDRSASSQRLSTTVVPGRADQQQASSAAAPATAQQAAGAFQAPASLAQTSAASPAFYGGSCMAAPTVQFQGRGLAATGIAPVTRTPSDSVTTLTVGVQERGTDAGSVLKGAQAKIAAVVAALLKVGVPDSHIQQSYYSYGDFQAKQFSGYATIQAQVNGGDQLAQASNAVVQVPGVSNYSTGSTIGAEPAAQAVQTAVVAAASQAKDMAKSTASASGVNLGSVESVVTQPPTLCWGLAGAVRTVQVTVTYGIK